MAVKIAGADYGKQIQGSTGLVTSRFFPESAILSPAAGSSKPGKHDSPDAVAHVSPPKKASKASTSPTSHKISAASLAQPAPPALQANFPPTSKPADRSGLDSYRAAQKAKEDHLRAQRDHQEQMAETERKHKAETDGMQKEMVRIKGEIAFKDSVSLA